MGEKVWCGYFFLVPINPPSTIKIARTIPAIGAPVVCIPTVLVVVAAFAMFVSVGTLMVTFIGRLMFWLNSF